MEKDTQILRGTIVIAEDDGNVREFMCDGLANEIPGYEVIACASGEQAIPVIRARWDGRVIISSDFGMGQGHMNGIEFIQAVRKSGMIVPSIIVSAGAEDLMRQHRGELQDWGIVAMYSKPPDLDEIIADLRAIDQRYEDARRGLPLRLLAQVVIL